MCKISVIMPAYNCAAFISEAMDSVLNQSETDLELIVVNDGSTDGTSEIINAKAQKDNRVKVVTQANSGKPSIARNRGLKMAKGEYVAFLDGDDLYIDEKLEKSLNVYQQIPGIDMVFHDVCLINSAGINQGATYLEAVNFAKHVLSESQKLGKDAFLCNKKALFFFMCTVVTTILTNSPLIRRKRLADEEVFFPEDLTIGEDIDLFFRLIRTGGVAFINQPLSSYRINPKSVTHRPDRNLYDSISSHIRNYKRDTGLLCSYQRKAYRKRIATDFYNIGYGCTEQGSHTQAFLAFLHSLSWHFGMAPIKGIVKTITLAVLRGKKVKI